MRHFVRACKPKATTHHGVTHHPLSSSLLPPPLLLLLYFLPEDGFRKSADFHSMTFSLAIPLPQRTTYTHSLVFLPSSSPSLLSFSPCLSVLFWLSAFCMTLLCSEKRRRLQTNCFYLVQISLSLLFIVSHTLFQFVLQFWTLKRVTSRKGMMTQSCWFSIFYTCIPIQSKKGIVWLYPV